MCSTYRYAYVLVSRVICCFIHIGYRHVKSNSYIPIRKILKLWQARNFTGNLLLASALLPAHSLPAPDSHRTGCLKYHTTSRDISSCLTMSHKISKKRRTVRQPRPHGPRTCELQSRAAMIDMRQAQLDGVLTEGENHETAVYGCLDNHSKMCEHLGTYLGGSKASFHEKNGHGFHHLLHSEFSFCSLLVLAAPWRLFRPRRPSQATLDVNSSAHASSSRFRATKLTWQADPEGSQDPRRSRQVSKQNQATSAREYSSSTCPRATLSFRYLPDSLHPRLVFVDGVKTANKQDTGAWDAWMYGAPTR